MHSTLLLQQVMASFARESKMNVSDLMTQNPVTIQQDFTLRVALETMERTGCHHLPVINQHGTLVGVLSSHDYRHALNLPSIVRRGNTLFDRLPVSAVMTLMPVVVQEHTPAIEAIEMMLNKHIGCLPVMNGKALIGIVTTSDILRACITLLKQFSEVEIADPVSQLDP
jgi:acetoin utilization protein AcuB